MANMPERDYLAGVTTLDFHATPYTPEEARARREAAIARAKTETGIDESLIDRLVETFYDKVRADDLLGPVFEAKIAEQVQRGASEEALRDIVRRAIELGRKTA